MSFFSMNLSSTFNQTIELRVGDITTVDTEAIVNPTNTHLRMVHGFDKNIKDAGGPPLIAEIEQLRAEKGQLTLYKAYSTLGGNLPANKVIHATIPRLKPKDRTLAMKPHQVFSVTLEILALAKKEKIGSIALPELGITGPSYLTPEQAAGAMVNALVNFFYNEETVETSLRVVIILSEEEFFNTYKAELVTQQSSLRKPEIIEEAVKELVKRIDAALQSKGVNQIPMEDIVQELQVSAPSELLYLSCSEDIADLLMQIEHPIPDFEFDFKYDLIRRRLKEGRDSLE